ncbi:MAG: MFS transporter [Candidatus Dormibacteraeota bacterium]|nr:MFS transporter [Candidatus Dormibacteraeota bacterium]
MADVAQTRARRYARIIPVAFLMYTIAFMDRLNISLALPQMSKELHFGAAVSGLAFGIFFFGYLVLQVPGGHLAERWSAKWFIFILLLVWGLFAVLTGFVQNTAQLLAVRFLLGVAEGGVWPAALVLLSHWFPRAERARANNLWMLCLPVSSVIAAPLGGLILANTPGFRWLFVLEGIPPLVWAVIWALVIPDSPKHVNWMTKEERDDLQTVLDAEREDRDRPDLGTYRRAMLSGTTWLFSVIYFLQALAGYGLAAFLPSLLKANGFSIGVVGILTALPFAMAIVGLLVVGPLSDRALVRRKHIAIPAAIMGVGFVLSGVLSGYATLSLIILVLAGFGLYAFLGPFWATVDQVMPPATAGGAMGFINGLGNLGGFVGPSLVGILAQVTHATHEYQPGFILLGVSALVMSVLAMQIRVREGSRAATPVAAGE